MDLKKQENESSFEYKLRLCNAKINKDIDIDWAEIVELLLQYGVIDEPISGDHQRKLGYGYKEYDDYIQTKQTSSLEYDISRALEEKRMEIQKEKYKLFDQRNALNRLLRARSRQEELITVINNAVSSGNLPQLTPQNMSYSDTKHQSMLVSLNDIHYGAYVNNAFCQYNPDVLVKMLENYLAQVIDIQNTHQVEECVVWVNGDMIHGFIHAGVRAETRENVISQVMHVSEILSNFLYQLSAYFPKIRFVSVSGNHSRLSSKEDALKDERLDDLVEWWLKARLQLCNNIVFNDYVKIDESVYWINVQGLNYLGCHGDYDGSPAKLQALGAMFTAQYNQSVYAVLLGHKHHNYIDAVSGIKTIMAGSFLGVDSFCITQRIYSKPEQLVTICNEKGIICHYDIQF